MHKRSYLVLVGLLLLTVSLGLMAEENETMSTTDLEQSEAAMFSELDALTEKVFTDMEAAEKNSETTNKEVKEIQFQDATAQTPTGTEIKPPTAPEKKQVNEDELEMMSEQDVKFIENKVQQVKSNPIETIDEKHSNIEFSDRTDVLFQNSFQKDLEPELPPGARFWEAATPSVETLGKNVDKNLLAGEVDDGFIHTNVYVRLRDCITMGLEKNLGLTIERYNPEYAREGIRIAKGAFDPYFAASIHWEGAKQPRPYVKVQSYKKKFAVGRDPQTGQPIYKTFNIPYNTKLHIGNSETEGTTYKMGIQGKFATGIQYTLGAGFTRSWTDQKNNMWGNPLFSAATTVSLEIPILRGFGVDVNMAPVRVARNNWRIAKESLDDYMQTFITQIVADYWTLYYWREQTGAEEYTLDLAKNLLYVTSNKRAVGLVASNEVIQAEARIASQEQALLSSRNAIRDSEDNLRYIINFEMNDLYRPKALRPYQYHLVPLEKPQVTDVNLNEAELIETALIKRKTLEVAKLQLKNAKENLKVAKSNLLPKLSVVTEAGFTGVGNTHDRAFTDEATGRHMNWMVGLDFVTPVFFWSFVGDYRQAKYAKEQATLSVENVQQAITIEVRTAIRAVQTNRKRITAAREATRLAYEQLYYEQEKYKAGLVTTYEVLELQSDLAQALSAEIKALVDWRISMSALSRAVGLALDFNDVVIEDYYKLPKNEEAYFTRFLFQ
ncbi:TolC family protein [bacterium]|nr:TolC family protein [bacterium]